MRKDDVYTIVAIKAPGSWNTGKYEFETLFATKIEAEYQDIVRILQERHAGFRRASYSRNRREVVVIGVDKEKHEQYLHGKPGRNGLTSQPVKRGQVFESSAAASGHIGLKNNEVSMMLSRAEYTTNKTATIRGVTFAYADEK